MKNVGLEMMTPEVVFNAPRQTVLSHSAAQSVRKVPFCLIPVLAELFIVRILNKLIGQDK